MSTPLPKPEPRGPKPRKRIARSTRPRKKRKRKPGHYTLDQLDDLARPLCHARGACEAQTFISNGPAGGCKGGLQWAHILSRSYYRVRYHPDNCLLLCAAHHRYWTSRPVEFLYFLRFKIGESNLATLERQATAIGPKPSRETIACDLRNSVPGLWRNALVIHQ